MEQISSGFTLFLKIVFPTFWFVFFGLLGLGTVFMNSDQYALLASTQFRLSYLLFFLIFGLFIYLTLMRLHRIDMDAKNIYISNYFKTYRYDYQSVKSISVQNWLLFSLGIIELHDTGKLGKKIKFLPRKKVLNDFANQHHDIFKDLLSTSLK